MYVDFLDEASKEEAIFNLQVEKAEEAEAEANAHENSISELTESMFAAMKKGFLALIRGTSKMTVGEAIYSLGESEGTDLIDAAICYLAESTDPRANEYARRIAKSFAIMHIGEEK